MQSVHFGAPYQQTSLHTSVAYTPACITSFCTFSDSTRLDPPAIWTHLNPVIRHLQSLDPSLKKNCILLAMGPPPNTDPGKISSFSAPYYQRLTSKLGAGISWKPGPSDGIVSVIKRTADSLVSKGIKDLPDARSIFEALSELKLDVKLFCVAEKDIAAIDNTDVIPEQIPAVPGTMPVHQVSTEAFGEISYRDVSCFCSGDGLCNCYEVSKVPLKAQMATLQNTTPSASRGVASDTAPRTVPAFAQQHPHRFTPGELTEDMEGKWCMVEYDGVPYPGIIQNVDYGEVEVNVMHKIGDNRYFWPGMNDTLWYRADQLLTLIPPTEKVTGRHQMVCPKIWNEVSKLLDL